MSNPQRIVSLLPGLTDTIFALGLGDRLVGISHECDLPAGSAPLPRVTSSRINLDAGSSTIDEQVRNHLDLDLFSLDTALLQELKPDLILTQAQCDVCAVSEATVRATVDSLPGRPRVVAVNPTNLSGVFGMIREIGSAVQQRQAAETIVRAFETAELSLDRQRSGQARPDVVHLEWLDPVMGSGHWNPELVRLAGGQERTSLPGAASRVLPQRQILEAFEKTRKVILGVCGFTVERTVAELNSLPGDHMLIHLLKQGGARIWALDGHRLMVRPGPLLLTSLRVLAGTMGYNDFTGFPKSLASLNLEPEKTDSGEIVWSSGGWLIRS